MLLWSKDFINATEMLKDVSNGYKGIKNPENIQGFAGYFLFCFGDIYVSEEIISLFEIDKEFEKTVRDALDKFKAMDYGVATEAEKDLNNENRLIFGANSQLVGKYETKYGILKIYIPQCEKTEITLLRINKK